MWLLRKYYAGGQGALPPTDPRILSMTPEQIEVEFEHMKLDAIAKKGGQVFEDDDYEKYDKESDEDDSLLSDMPTFGSEGSDPYKSQENQLPKNVETNNPDDWEDVEIDDFEGE